MGRNLSPFGIRWSHRGVDAAQERLYQDHTSLRAVLGSHSKLAVDVCSFTSSCPTTAYTQPDANGLEPSSYPYPFADVTHSDVCCQRVWISGATTKSRERIYAIGTT